MASCDDDFALLGEEATQPHHHHHNHHPHPHSHHSHPHPQQQPHQHQQAAAAASASFITHRFVTTKPAVSIHPHSQPLLHPHSQSHPHPHSHPLSGITSPKKGIGGGGDEDDSEDPEDYGDAFAQTDASKVSAPPASFHDVDPPHCFSAADDAVAANPFATQPPEEDEDDGDDHHHLDRKGGAPVGAAVGTHLSRPDLKRKDRDELSDGGSPYCFSSGGGGVSSKKPRPATSAAAGAPSSSGDYRKDREEWSDSAIGCLLDAYTEKYVQLNRGNLRGRDWEDVATIVSERCDKQKSGKSVEQCKNKVDNLKKRYKAERQRLSSGSLSVSHWPWFKKMEQIVGSSSSSTSAKPVSDDDKSTNLGGGGSSTALVRQNKRYAVATPGPVSLTNNLKMKSSSNPRWRRVVLKISGAAFTGNGPQNVDPKVAMLIAREIAMANHLGVEVAIVVGGRNFFCGDTWVAATGIDRPTAYQIGMMATVMNSILLQASLEKIGVQTRVQTSFMMQEIAEPYIRRRAIRHLEKGRVVIFGGIGAGTGNPLFTTDTAAALRASEINADAVLKGTNVDSVYDCHSRNNNSVTYEHISFRELVSRGFTAMDMTAITFCEENNIPVLVFNLLEPGNISRALCGDQVGTLIDQLGRIS